MLVAEEPIEVAPMGIATAVRAGVIALSRSDTGPAGAAAADVGRLCNAWGMADISCEPPDVVDFAAAAACCAPPAGLVVGGGWGDRGSVGVGSAGRAGP